MEKTFRMEAISNSQSNQDTFAPQQLCVQQHIIPYLF